MLLREFIKEDSAVICKWMKTEEELYKWSADRFNKFPLLENDINENYLPQIAEKRFFPLTATDESGRLLGHFIIRYPRNDDDSLVRFGFVIVNPEFRGRGYGKEMLKLGVKYVKERMKVKRIDLGVFVNNESARYCYEAVGFKEYNRRKCEMPIGTWECIDMQLYV